ncbi:MAG TPA: class I SAM-dependent methyltransferase [Mesorhizobium sp.]|jgi:tocopherol O-methyltransferase|nr:class I SAM-dependent methyltransferase [Mesorhizobium sp.]
MIVPKKVQTAAAVARHYDELDPFYREVWGEHVHHGLWRTGRESPREAVEALIDHLAERLGLQHGQKACDIGCGYGGTARRLAERFGAHVTGLTISSVQAARAQALAVNHPEVEILCRDWLQNGLPDTSFDRAWSIESSEHMEDKSRFFAEAFRVLRPGGRLGVYAWLSRETPSMWEIRHLLEPICREGRLPGMGTESEYREWAQAAGFRVIGFKDLSRNVRRTWTICAQRLARKLATRGDYRRFLLSARAENRVFALTLPRLILAYRTDAMRYGLLVAEKPAH